MFAFNMSDCHAKGKTYVSVEFSEGVEAIETVHVHDSSVDTQLIPAMRE